MKIEFFYWEDCPSYRNALARLEAILIQTGIEEKVNRFEVNTDEEAKNHAFLGSPTIRINGSDIDPDGAKEQRVGLSCRIYHEDDGRVTPLPPEKIIREALQKAIQEGGNP